MEEEVQIIWVHMFSVLALLLSSSIPGEKNVWAVYSQFYLLRAHVATLHFTPLVQQCAMHFFGVDVFTYVYVFTPPFSLLIHRARCFFPIAVKRLNYVSVRCGFLRISIKSIMLCRET